jgi:hypothetical protein
MRFFGYTLAIMFIFLFQNASAQQYASTVSSSHIDNGDAIASVTNEANAVGAADGNYAVLSASGIKVLALTSTSSASLTLNMASEVPAGKKSYIKINAPTTDGISLDLGSLVNLLNLFTNQTVIASTGGSNVPAALVRDPANNLYIAVTPAVAYSSITLTLDFANSVSGLGIGLGSISLEVDNITTYETTGFTPCQALPFAFTEIDPHATGISASVLSSTLQEPYKAIDGVVSANNYSVLQNGAVAVASTVSQTFYLGKTSPQGNQVLATISRPGALANLSVLQNISIQAYLGSEAVGGSRTINGLLVELDLLTLFTNNGLATVSFVPTGAFDRIVVTSATLANANLFTGLLIHELSSRPPITFTGGNLPTAQVGIFVDVNLNAAVLLAGVPTLPGFSIACGGFADYTYTLEGVTLVTGRTQSGTLPNTLSLTTAGKLTGTPTFGQDGIYNFQVRARNIFGQSAVADFRIQIEEGLPVTLVSFKATSEGPVALLSWSTAAETNSDRFDIERSQNGKKWEKIGSVKSNQESVTQRFYDFKDANPLDGQNLYRLKMIDLDETFSYSHIENVNFANAAYIYPNPVRNAENLNLNLTDWSKVKMVKVVNAQGKTVFEASNALTTGISTRNLSSGAYVVQVIHTNGMISAHKFIRQ